MQVGRRNDHPEWSEAKSKEDKCVARKILIAKNASRAMLLADILFQIFLTVKRLQILFHQQFEE
jgi:hypothetical protein